MFIDTPIDEAIKRDPKGLYAKALKGEIAHFTGISSPYEEPENPEIVLKTTELSAQEAADKVVAALAARGVI